VRVQGGESLVVEELDPTQAQDLSDENEDIEKFLGAQVLSRVWRLSFFTKILAGRSGLASVHDEDFIGYVIVKRDASTAKTLITRVYESVIRPTPHDDNFIRGSREWRCRVGRRTFRVWGYIYAQQNGMTNVCAHAACRTAAARFHRDGDMTYREMNDLPSVAIDHGFRKADEGLTTDQMVAVLEAAGARCLTADFTKAKRSGTGPPFEKYVYGSVESGYPVIVCFATSHAQYHAIPMFGHTFNQDMWVANAQRYYFRVGSGTVYVPSDRWVTGFIGHDDNFGSNYCVPTNFLHTKRLCVKPGKRSKACHMDSECVAYVIATLPKKIKVSPIQAEVIAADYLFTLLPQLAALSGFWGKQLERYAEDNLIVLRPILVDGSEYTAHLSKLKDWDRDKVRRDLIAWLKPFRPTMVWIVEVSVPELFSANRRKLGEVVLLAEQRPGQDRDFGNFLLARVPGFFAFCTGDLAKPEFLFEPSGVQGHVPLFGCEDSAALG
jgi:hypothetical protein